MNLKKTSTFRLVLDVIFMVGISALCGFLWGQVFYFVMGEVGGWIAGVGCFIMVLWMLVVYRFRVI